MADQANEILVLSSTQIGKSYAAVCKLLTWMWPYRGPWPWWWVAPKYAQTRQSQRIIYELTTSCGAYVSGPRPPFATTPPPPLVLVNGATCEFRSWDDPSNLMGDTIAGAVVEEAGLETPWAQSAISTRRSATLGPTLRIGNPGLFSGPFRRLIGRAQAAIADPTHAAHGRVSFHRWTWRDYHAWLLQTDVVAAARYQEFIAGEQATLIDAEYRRLYEAEFTEDEAAMFRNVAVVIDGDPLTAPHPQARYTIGVDVGQQVDYLAAVVFDRTRWRVDAMDRYRGVSYPVAAQRLRQMHEHWNADLVVEENGPGEVLCRELELIDCPFMRFKTTARSKQEIVTQLASDFQQQSDPGGRPMPPKIRIADLPALQYELEVFRYERTLNGYRYGAPEGEHDDTVMALAIARWGAMRSGPFAEFL